MVRYAVSLRGEPSSADEIMNLQERIVDLHRDENLAEGYLLEVNPKGQVPAMASSQLPKPLVESLDITFLVAKSYPQLLPKTYESAIRELLSELHGIQPLSLSAPPLDNPAEGAQNPSIRKLLERVDISQAWREALTYKQDFHDRTLLWALNEDAIANAKAQARKFFEHIRKLLLQVDHTTSVPTWVFGENVGPTALDAHTVPFVARLTEAGHQDLIPIEVQQYAAKAMAGKEWHLVMQGKPTLWAAYLAVLMSSK